MFSFLMNKDEYNIQTDRRIQNMPETQTKLVLVQVSWLLMDATRFFCFVSCWDVLLSANYFRFMNKILPSQKQWQIKTWLP